MVFRGKNEQLAQTPALKVARGRVFFLGVVVVIGFLLVSLRLVDLTLLRPMYVSSDMAALPPDVSKPQAARADIFDRNGVLLATSLKTASLYADPKMIDDPKLVAGELVKILPELDLEDTIKKLKMERRFIWLYRNLTPRQEYEINALGHPGLNFIEENRRIYPQGNLLSHVVGYTDVDGNGIAGVEKSFDKALLEGDTPLRLTIDTHIQHMMHRELSKAVKTFSAKGGVGLVLDVQSGEVISMVSLPDFDPHHPNDTAPQNKFNQATLGVFEMGSTFKLFSIAAALESGMVKIGDIFDATKALKFGRYTISDFHAKAREMSVPEIFMYSSNIGAARIAMKIGSANLKAFYESLGLLKSARIELPEIGAPMVPNPWRDISSITASYGHGIAVSPLQVVRAAAGVVSSDGLMPNPSLILNTDTDSPGSTKTQVVSPATSVSLRQLMELTVADGTGEQAGVEGYRVGGKTGTAEKSENGGYNTHALLSSFLGAFPMNNPRYVVLAIIDEPKGTKESYGFATGGWTAAPVVGHVISEMAPMLNISPLKTADIPDITKMMDKYLLEGKKRAAF